ncbi:DUF3987 domain-containing protein [bacterium]|nr:DUF3987 domain-containing protein [bacterium]
MSDISVYKAPVKNILPYQNVTLFDVYQEIKSDKHKRITVKLRGITSKAEKGMCKSAEFDYVTFSGTFTKRANTSLIKHSYKICIDIDHVGESSALNELKQQIRSILEPELIFISPSGDGLKVVFHIDISQATHDKYFLAFQNFFKSELITDIDPSCKDVSRATFLCHDPDCFYAETPTIVGKEFITKYTTLAQPAPKEHIPTAPKVAPNSSSVMYLPLQMIHNSSDGMKHYCLLKASRLTGGYIAAGQIDEAEAIRQLEEAIQKKEIVSFPSAQQTILDGIEHGKLEPLEAEQPPTNVTETPPMPIDGFPPFIQELINDCSRIYGTHADLWSFAFFAATSTAIGQSVILKTRFENPPLFWMAVVAPSGMGKTPPLDFALQLIHDLDYRIYLEYQQQMKQYEREVSQWQKGKGVPKPEEPLPCKQYILVDSTPEAMAQALEAHPRGITILREELHGWFLDFGKYTKSGEQQNMLSSWSQQVYKTKRVGRKGEFIKKPNINVYGGIQTGLLTEMAKDNRSVNGFLQRFCFVFPDKIEAPVYNRNELSYDVKSKYRKYITNLLEVIGYREEIWLSDEAEQLYEVFYNKNRDLINSGKQPDYISECTSKFNIIVLRTAVLFHCSQQAINGPGSHYINAPTMQSAITLTEYFRITANKVYGIISQNSSNQKDVAKYLAGLDNSQTDIAKVLKVSQPYINKILK